LPTDIQHINYYPQVLLHPVNNVLQQQVYKLPVTMSKSNAMLDSTFIYRDDEAELDANIGRCGLNLEQHSPKLNLLLKKLEQGGRHLVYVPEKFRNGISLVKSIFDCHNVNHFQVPLGRSDKELRKMLYTMSLTDIPVILSSIVPPIQLFGITDVHFIDSVDLDLYDRTISALHGASDSVAQDSQKLDKINFHYYITEIMDDSGKVMCSRDIAFYNKFVKDLAERKRGYNALTAKSKSMIKWSI
jgi:hypothetical protein